MASIFSKQNRYVVNISDNGMRERKLYTYLSIFLFVDGAFIFWEIIYELSHMIGAIVSGSPEVALLEIKRMFPLYMLGAVVIYLGLKVISAFRAYDEQNRIDILRITGNVTIALCIIVVIYVIVGVITGYYGGLVEGYPSLLFPMDILLGGLLFGAFGGWLMRYSYRLKKRHTALPFRTLLKKNGKRYSLIGPLYILSYMIAMCGFAATIRGVYVMDWAHGSLSFNFAFILTCCMAFLMFIAYRFIYMELDEDHKPVAQIFLGGVFFAINTLIFIWYVISVNHAPEAPGQNAFGLLPADFTASFNVFFVVYGYNNVIVPLAVTVKGVLARKAKK